MGHVSDAGERVVLREIAGLGGALADEAGQPLAGGVGDVLVEGARAGAHVEDPRDRGVVEGGEAQRVGQGGRDVGAVVALAEREDLAGVMRDGAALAALEAAQEVGGGVAELGEDGPEHLEVGRPRRRRAARERDALVGAFRQPLVDDDWPQVRGVDVHLGRGDADRQESRDMLVGDLVEVALEGDAAGGVAQAIDDARGVVGSARQRQQVRRLGGKAPGDRSPVTADDPLIGDLIHPAQELGVQVGLVVEAATVEEAALQLPEAALDPRLVIGVRGPGELG